MDTAIVVILAHLKDSSHVMWDEVAGETRSTLTDLVLDNLAYLSYRGGKPYAFMISNKGRLALQAWEMGDV